MQILFLNRYFHPDHSATSQLLSDLAFAAAEKGWTVSIITSRQIYDDINVVLPETETVRKVHIHRVWTSRFGRDRLLGRFLDYVTFYISAARALFSLVRRGDIIVAKTDPPMLSILVRPIAWVKRAHQINWLQDLFPEIAQVYGLGKENAIFGGVHALLRALRNWSLRHSTFNVTIGKSMARRLEKETIPKDKIRVIENWADGTVLRPIPHPENPLRQAGHFRENFVVAHSGNLGRAHDYQTFLSAIGNLQENSKSSAPNQLNPQGVSSYQGSKISWLFIGGGAHYEILKKNVLERGLSGVTFLPYQDQKLLAESLCVADVHFITLSKPFESLMLPSKFYGIAAVGRPIIFVGAHQGDIQDLLRKAECGFVVAEGDHEGMTQAIRTLAENKEIALEMGRRARALFEKNFNRSIAIMKWQKLFEEIQPQT